MIIFLLIVFVSAIALRDEGGGAAQYLPSTFLARLVPTGALSTLIAVLSNHASDATYIGVLWSLLFIAKAFAIDPYSQIALNGDITNISQKRFPPADWVMSLLKLPYDTNAKARLWGTVATAIRTSLWAPAIAWVAFNSGHDWRVIWDLFAPLMAVGYFLGGLIPAVDPRIHGEQFAGALLGAGLAGAALGMNLLSFFG